MAKVMTTLTQNNSTIVVSFRREPGAKTKARTYGIETGQNATGVSPLKCKACSPRFQTPGCNRLELEPVSEVLSLPEMDRCHTPRVGVAVRRCQAMMVGNIGNRRSEKYSHLMLQ
jgi:hypothetical protein